MTFTQGYSISDYGDMINDNGRMLPYAARLKEVVGSQSVVVDIGAGTGIFTLLACRYGAKRVHCVEPDPAMEVARQAVIDNGFQDGVIFHNCLSTSLKLTERADIVVSDLRGIPPLMGPHLSAIIDARTRLLSDSGILIPACDRIWGSFVEMDKTHQTAERPWVVNDFDLDLRSGHSYVVNSGYRRVTAKPEQLLCRPFEIGRLDYHTVSSTDFSGELLGTATRGGVIHGLLIWFDSELGVDRSVNAPGFSNAPGLPPLIYGQAFFPLEKKVDVEEGDKLSADIQARYLGGDYVWVWRTQIVSGGSGQTAKAEFEQSTFLGAPILSDALRYHSADTVPSRTAETNFAMDCLSLIDGERSIKDIAIEISQRYPRRFESWEQAVPDIVGVLGR